jgi:hypothetical protein
MRENLSIRNAVTMTPGDVPPMVRVLQTACHQGEPLFKPMQGVVARFAGPCPS